MRTREFNGILDEFTSSILGTNVSRFQASESFIKAQNTMFFESALTPRVSTRDKLRTLVGKEKKYDETVGGHPDFDQLKHGETENHYIVSVFADIKGSTKLATKLPLEDVRRLKNAALTTMIEVFQAFDGHIHRLQGDGMLAFFGRKSMRRSQAIVDAMNAAAFLQYLFKRQLSPRFEAEGLPSLRIRVGIDFGNCDQVLWSRYGLRYCDEVTTTSLHTDLAAKLQGHAPSNGIMIGDNVRDFLDLPDEFYKTKTIERDGEKNTVHYVLNYNEIKYKMWSFDWQKYLGRFLFNPERLETSLYKAGENFDFRCYYQAGDNWLECNSNCLTLTKGLNLKFELSNIGFKYQNIRWFVNNRGKEASAGKYLDFEMEKERDNTICLQETKYTGHHYMACKIFDAGRVVADERIGIYINNQ